MEIEVDQYSRCHPMKLILKHFVWNEGKIWKKDQCNLFIFFPQITRGVITAYNSSALSSHIYLRIPFDFSDHVSFSVYLQDKLTEEQIEGTFWDLTTLYRFWIITITIYYFKPELA